MQKHTTISGVSLGLSDNTPLKILKTSQYCSHRTQGHKIPTELNEKEDGATKLRDFPTWNENFGQKSTKTSCAPWGFWTFLH